MIGVLAALARRKIVCEVSDSLPTGDTQVPVWAASMRPLQLGPLRRLIRALLSLSLRRPGRAVPGYDEGQPPPEGAGVPARPKGPTPTSLAAAEVELPRDSD